MFSSHSVEPAHTEVSHPACSGNACHETVEDLQIFPVYRIIWQMFLLC